MAVVSDRKQISDLSASLVNTARKDWMTLENLATDMPLTEDFTQPPLPADGGQVRCRSIYAAAAMDDPAARQIIEACAEAGEQARLLPRVPMKMKLADMTTAMLPLTPDGTAAALVIRAPVIITALREYFELLWDRATPLKPDRQVLPADRLPPVQQKVLELMAEGLNDDAHRPPPGHQHHHGPTAYHGDHAPASRHQQVRRGGSRPASRMDRVGHRFPAAARFRLAAVPLAPAGSARQNHYPAPAPANDLTCSRICRCERRPDG